ncbi:transporter substrate-binding domain-containing protein [Guptibacillus spartinae]|uniref:transporter substrate-binding domain-containing protein n=1 Tax=Guptibacillus spartinae TaxID=3025679 RepID=UPI002361A3B2|nr:transporter substrate-binding domain-containing protein [Pseudalkalibacillus spartinae]
MNKKWMVGLVLALTLTVLAACGSNENTENGEEGSSDEQETLLIGTEATYPPFSYRDDNNEITGYDVEVAREVADRIGMKAEFKAIEWKGLLSSLETERIDMVANQVTITDDRKEQFDFTEPYTYSGGQVIVNENNEDIKGIEDLEGKTVGTTQGSNYAQAAEEAGAETKIYKGANQVLTDLSNERNIDAAMNDRLFILTELPEQDYKVKGVGETFNKTEMAFALPKGNDDLIKKINDALKEMKEDGTLADISKEYFDGENVSE